MDQPNDEAGGRLDGKVFQVLGILPTAAPAVLMTASRTSSSRITAPELGSKFLRTCIDVSASLWVAKAVLSSSCFASLLSRQRRRSSADEALEDWMLEEDPFPVVGDETFMSAARCSVNFLHPL